MILGKKFSIIFFSSILDLVNTFQSINFLLLFFFYLSNFLMVENIDKNNKKKKMLG